MGTFTVLSKKVVHVFHAQISRTTNVWKWQCGKSHTQHRTFSCVNRDFWNTNIVRKIVTVVVDMPKQQRKSQLHGTLVAVAVHRNETPPATSTCQHPHSTPYKLYSLFCKFTKAPNHSNSPKLVIFYFIFSKHISTVFPIWQLFVPPEQSFEYLMFQYSLSQLFIPQIPRGNKFKILIWHGMDTNILTKILKWT